MLFGFVSADLRCLTNGLGSQINENVNRPGSSIGKRDHSEMVAGGHSPHTPSLPPPDGPLSSVNHSSATGSDTQAADGQALATGLEVGDLSREDSGPNESRAPKRHCAHPEVDTEGNTTGSSNAVHALLSRWLCDDVSTALLRETE